MTSDVFDERARHRPTGREPILRVAGLGVDFNVDGEWMMASQDVAFDIDPGEVLAVVGESGSGKSVSAMSILGLLPKNARVTGSATLRGEELIGAGEPALRAVRGKDIALIFQEPMTALNPVLTVGFQVNEVLLSHFDLTPQAARARVLELMKLVDLPDPEGRYDLYPHQLSGGQRQRIMIAMSLACDPVLLIADEPTTALDVTVQAEILDLLRDLHQRLDSAILLITHDMGVVADLADRVVVMREGRIVETGTAQEVFAFPQNDYTQDLLAAVPHLGSEVGFDAEDAQRLGDEVDAAARDIEAATRDVEAAAREIAERCWTSRPRRATSRPQRAMSWPPRPMSRPPPGMCRPPPPRRRACWPARRRTSRTRSRCGTSSWSTRDAAASRRSAPWTA